MSPFRASRRVFLADRSGDANRAPVCAISGGQNDSILSRGKRERLHGTQHVEMNGRRLLRKANRTPAKYDLEGTFNSVYLYGFEDKGNQEAVRPQVVLDAHDAPADYGSLDNVDVPFNLSLQLFAPHHVFHHPGRDRVAFSRLIAVNRRYEFQSNRQVVW